MTVRQEALESLGKEATRDFDGRPRPALLHGPEGIGTSTLAIHWAWRQQARFPDGQLYADLRTLGPEAALATLLRQLGLPDEEVPPAAADRADLLRRCLADRRLLLVLDHAQSAGRVRALLTSAPGVVTLVVARQPPAGLDALRVPVGPLARKDAVRLLTDLVGKPAIGAARATLPGVLDRCAGSPYALRAAAPRLTIAPSATTTESPAGDRAPDAVGAATEDSYRLLTLDAARLYRLAGLHAWPASTPPRRPAPPASPSPRLPGSSKSSPTRCSSNTRTPAVTAPPYAPTPSAPLPPPTASPRALRPSPVPSITICTWRWAPRGPHSRRAGASRPEPRRSRTATGAGPSPPSPPRRRTAFPERRVPEQPVAAGDLGRRERLRPTRLPASTRSRRHAHRAAPSAPGVSHVL
ncbi:hypothetical protein [Streptomyces sp. SID12501]|uniref:hypothetical protein n=1 Tax=Streptomyces sp. SID12501 TaxID=2706042 RepID=UPI001943476D|nr:hypothetical protein [Streptomyces sp. SID12501]